MRKIISVCMAMFMMLLVAIPVLAVDTDYSCSPNSTGITIEKYLGSEENVVIPDTIFGNTVTEINSRAFFENTTIKSVKIPATVTFIGELVFAGDTSLTSISVDPSNPNFASDGTLLYRKENKRAISYACGSPAKSYTVPSSIKIIAPNCFWGSQNLVTVTTNKGLSGIGYYSFAKCDNLKSLYVSDPSTFIDPDLFFEMNPATTIYYDGEIDLSSYPAYSLKILPYPTETTVPPTKPVVAPKETDASQPSSTGKADTSTSAVSENSETTVVTDESTTVGEPSSETVTEALATAPVVEKNNATLIKCLVAAGVLLLAAGVFTYFYMKKRKTSLPGSEKK
ncbi:MAG: leucine-rich repeat domain-containing protein [Clostridiales bacterium]|nr:leucine-rich repeat domain-containing protein [Clostridiales bacterium]